ncbi:MAG: VanZ family protein [Oscillospiraceae bacterium]|nr:VanZ family protein [Oscillospiraceae bacterium]
MMKRKFLWAGFAAYILLMLWLLFIRHRGVEITDYWAQLAGRINLVPFSSMGSMLRTLWYNPYPAVLWTVVYNIGGNIIMFVPLGFFLRVLVPKCRKFWRCMGAVAIIMTTVELCQLITLRGFCEIDDLMLNLLGAAMGWTAAKWTRL